VHCARVNSRTGLGREWRHKSIRTAGSCRSTAADPFCLGVDTLRTTHCWNSRRVTSCHVTSYYLTVATTTISSTGVRLFSAVDRTFNLRRSAASFVLNDLLMTYISRWPWECCFQWE